MNRETRSLIDHLERERESIVVFIEEIDRQVRAGTLSQEIANSILDKEFNGKDPRAHLVVINHELAQLRSLATNASSSTIDSVAPIALIAVLAIAIVWNFGAITGLFTATDETFYALPLGQRFTTDAAIPLAIGTPLTSLRVDGSITGTGEARIELVKDGTSYLIAAFAPETPGALTGFVVDDTSPDDAGAGADEDSVEDVVSADIVSTDVPTATDTAEETTSGTVAETNSESGSSTETADEPLTDTLLADEPLTESTDERSTSESSSEPAAESSLESVLEPTVELDLEQESTPAAPSLPSSPPPSNERVATLDAACVETCFLPRVTAPLTLRITVSGDVTVTIDTIIYGTRDEPLPQRNPSTPPNEETSTPVEQSSNTSSQNSSVEVSGGESDTETPFTTPPTTEPTASIATCTADADCTSGVCITDRYQGTLSRGLCAPARDAWCAEGTTVHPVATTLDDSTCVAGTSVQGTRDATWIANAGQGRFTIQSKNGSLIASIDKYGTMLIRGTATFATTAGSEGWLITDASGTPRLSIDDTGSLRSEGILSERANPERTANGDFVIRNAQGNDAAVITQSGAVTLTGDFLSSATLQ